MIKEEVLIKDLKRVYNLVGKPPTRKEYKKYGKFYPDTLSNRIGDKLWSNVLFRVFREYNITPKGISTILMVPCDKCGSVFKKAKSQIEKTNHNFCSRNCAAIYNNKTNAKKKRTKQCRKCGSLIRASNTYCTECWKNSICLPSLSSIINPISQYITNSSKGPNRYRTIRDYAVKTAKVFLDRSKCENCGYYKHTQVCHINSISSYSVDTPLGIVNSPRNLIILCPNCHWELDHDCLNIHDIIEKRIYPI